MSELGDMVGHEAIVQAFKIIVSVAVACFVAGALLAWVVLR